MGEVVYDIGINCAGLWTRGGGNWNCGGAELTMEELSGGFINYS